MLCLSNSEIRNIIKQQFLQTIRCQHQELISRPVKKHFLQRLDFAPDINSLHKNLLNVMQLYEGIQSRAPGAASGFITLLL